MKLENDAGQSRVDDVLGDSIGGVTETIQPVLNDQVVLPAGVTLEDLSVEGRDLVVTLADGSRIIIPDGAVDVPAIVIGGVIVPPQNVAQLLTGNEPEPDAGAQQSSGGNFAGDEGEIQAAFNIGDLLPFTELAFPEFPEEEIIPNVDDEPEVVIETIDNPVGVENATATVGEDGLPERGEPEGTQADTDNESTSGTIVFEATDGLAGILINGVAITAPGQVISTPLGDLTITAINLETGEVDFDYTLTDNLVGEGTDPFVVTIIDADGDEAIATLNIIITDDGPIAQNDLGTVAAGSHDPITGDVLVNDVSGADGYAPEGAVQGFGNSSGTAEPGDTIQGEFGTLTLNADGTYTYMRDLDTPGGVEESFDYTIVDADGSTSSAVLTIQIEDSPAVVTDVPRIGDGTSVNEGALAPRSGEPVGSSEGSDGDAGNNSDPSESTGATISFNSPDGLGSVTLNGVVLDPGNLPQTVISDGTGILVVTGITYDPVTGDGTIDYDYTLIDNTSGDDTTVEVVIVVTDLDGDAAEDTLVINIIDDEPAAADDSEDQIGEDAPVTIDVLANDTPGADDVDPNTIAVVDGTLSGDGTLVNNGDGTFTYTPGPGEEGTVTFDYTITDGDGDVATATATIDLLPDSEPEISAQGNDVADEAGLGARGDEPAGSDAANDSEFASGTISINTGNDTVESLVVNGTDVTNGGTVTTDKGVLTVTLNGGVYEYTYELTDNTLTEPDSDPFAVTVTDSDGDTASTTIVISILDDAPSAADDEGSIAAGEYGPIGGDVFINDTQGADGAAVTSYTGVGGTGDAGETVQGEYGVLTIAEDGTYSYTRDPGTPGGVSDTFNYIITDGDGDTANADLVITIGNSVTTLDLPAAGQDGTLVDEAGLDGPPAGSDAALDSETTDGTFTFTAPDGPATVTIDGIAVTTVGQTFTGTFGTLEITSIVDGAIGYTYTLDGNTNGDTTADSFDVRVTDIDGDFSESALEIAIIDDVPTAVADINSVTEGASATGNVLTDNADTFGADGAQAAGGVVGVRAAGGDTATDASGSVGATINGLYGTLTLNADGSYTYASTSDAITADAVDVFVYTIEDGDGDLSTTTLTIDVADVTLAPDNDTLAVNEAALDAVGSDPTSGAETATGQLAVAGAVNYVLDSASDTYGTLTLNPDGSYTYTLTAPFDTSPDADNGTNTETGAESYSYTATDADGNTVTGTITVDTIDDVPTAVADINSVTEGASATGNVLTDNADTFGADGAQAAGGVVGVRAAGGDTATDASGSVGATINGLYGTLTLNADGSYTYASTSDAITADAVDVFVYTIEDGDGDLSTTTLTIDVADVTLAPDNDTLAVNEAALDAVGSDPTSGAETATGQLAVAGAVNYVLDSASDTYGTLTLNPDGSYTYTLTAPFDTSPDADNGTNTETGAESYSYTATDADGNTVTGTITVDTIDDVPTAVADINSVTEGASATGNVLTDNADTFGADGAQAAGGVVGVRAAGGDTATDASGSVGATINGLYGTLTLNADGSYTYASTSDAITADAVDVFVYTIEDGDGDLSTTTLTIDVADVTLAPDNDTLAVNEAALDAVGSDPTSGAETATGQLAVAGAVNYVLDSASDTYGTLTLNPDGSYTYTLTAPFDTSPDADNGTNTETGAESYSYTATDADGNTVTGTITVDIIDDVPTATDNSADVAEGASVAGNVLTDDDGAGVDGSGADGFGTPSTVTEIFSVGENTTQSTLDASGNLVITTSLGILTVDPVTGDYTYVSTANSTNTDVTDSFTYTIVDGDGDEAMANLVIDVTNAPGVVSDNDVIVNEAGLSNGSDPTSGSEIDSDGQISVVGATGTLVYTLLSPADGTYGTIELNSSDGTYKYTLDTPFTDTVDENGTNTVNGAESFNYEVRDTNGNLIGTGAIDVSIIDDIPTATDQTNITVAEDAAGTIGGNVTTDGVDDTQGADGATVTAITIGTATTAVPQDGSSATVTTANGVYTIDMDGNWTFDPNTGLDQTAGNIDASFTYTLTDGDGDFDTAVQPITIIDGQIPLAGPDITLALDDQNLADGSTPAADDFASDTIVFTQGSDAIAGIVFGDVSALGGGLTWTRVSDTQITGEDGGRLVVTLDLSVSGTTATVTATLNDNFDDHPVINVDDLADLGDVDVIATDIDGDTASSTVSVTVSDDLPTITASAPAADALTVDETDLSTNATADFSALFTSAFNADNPGTPEVYTLGVNAGPTGLVDTATNEAVVLTLNGNVIEGRTSGTGDLVFTVSVDASGTVTLDQQRAVKHADTNDDNDDAVLAAANLITLTATIVDSDGDTASATANIAGAMTFLDDGPDLSNVTLGSSVSVDETDGLSTSATSAASILSFTSDFGEDGDNGTAFALNITNANSGLATADGDFPITLVQTSATVITGVFDDGTGDQPAFTVTINADGTITLTQIVALEHVIDGDNSAGEHNDTLNLDGNISATVTITDGDGDTDSATLPVGGALTFFDDGPSVVLSGVNDSLSVSDADFGADDSTNFADNFTFDGGEDGAASTGFALVATNGTDSGLVDTATGNRVFLFVESGEVVGREGTDAAAAASGAEVFTVSVDSIGNVELDQSRAVDHALSTGSNGSSVSLASDGLIQLIGTVTDNDGDTASQALDIGSNLTFADDIPAAGTNDIVLLDDDALGGNPGGTNDDPDAAFTTGTLDHDFGNDDGSIAFATTGAPTGFQYVASGDDILIQQDQGSGFVTVVTVTLDPDTGDYTVTQNLNILHADGDTENNAEFTIGYTVTDGDTDTATSALVINVDDDTPTATNDGEIDSVDDNASGENVGTIATLTGNDSYGADGAGSPAITIAAGTLGGTVTIDGSGNLLYTSATDITDPYADQVETFTYTITDGDGDTATATFQIRLTDEGPAINADAATFTVDEEGLGGIAGNGDDGGDIAGEITVQSGTLAGIDFGTDGAGDVTLTAVADTGLVTLAGNAVETVWDGLTGTLTGQDAVTGDDVFTLVITDVATGAYTFTLLAPVAHPVADTEDDQSFTVGVVVTDAEGESASGTISITIDDDSPVATDDTNALTEDTSSVSGNVVTDTVADNFGADGAGDPEVTAVTGLGGAAGAVNGSTTGAFGTLMLNDDGSYTYNLNTALVQGLDDGESETDTFTYTIVDADGDTSDATLTITINGANDAPVAVADTNWTVEEAGAAITGNVLQTVAHNGAPDAAPRGDVADTDVDGDTLSVTTVGSFNGTYGILTLNSDGTYGYDLYTAAQNQAGFDAVQALDEGDAPLSDVFNYTASDGDASSNSTLTIDIFGANDAPVVTGSVAAVSEEGLTGGLADTAGNPTDTTDASSDSGQITITDADDATFTVTLGAPTTPGLTSNGLPINWQVSPDGTALVGSTTAGNVLLASIDDAGNWTVDLVGPIDHPDATSEDVFTFDIPVSVSDGTATTSITDGITVTVEDDSPDASLDVAGLSVTHDETAGNDADADDVTGPIAAFASVTNAGDDPDVAGTVIGFAQDLSGLVSTGTGLGGDGAGSTVFELNVSAAGVDSGLDTTEGANIVLFKEGDVIVGRVGNQSGEAAFAVAVDSATGAVSVVQYLSIEHPIGGTASPDEAVSITSGAIIASVTATDADGDTSTATAAIGDAISFEDDAGTLGAPSPATQTIGNFANASAAGTFAYDTGSDGHGSFNITGPALTGVTYSLDQNAVDITDDSVNNPIAGATLTATADSTGDTLFTISVDEDGNYEFTLVTPEAATTETISLLGLTAGGPTPFAETATGNVEFSSTTGGVNSSTVGFGVANQFVGAGQQFQIEFHSPGQPGDQPALTNPNFVTSAELGNDGSGGGNVVYQITIFNDATGQSEVVYSGLITGSSTLIEPITLTEFNRIEIEGVSGGGQGARFTSLDFSKTILPGDADLDFQVTATDGDGDVTSSSIVNVMVDASIAAPTSSASGASTMAFSTSRMLLDDPIDPASNDNDGGRGSGNGMDSFVSMQELTRADMRLAETTLVAAISGAVLIDQTLSASSDGGQIASGAVSYESMPIDAVMMDPTIDGPGFDHNSDMSGLIEAGFNSSAGENDWGSLSADNALATSPELSIGLQAEPDVIELAQFDSGFDAIGQSAAFFEGTATGVDQAMEALLMMEPSANATSASLSGDPLNDGLSGLAEEVLADIVAEFSIDQILELLEDESDASNYLVAEAGAIDMGLLDQTIEGPMSMIDPVGFIQSQADEAAATVAAA